MTSARKARRRKPTRDERSRTPRETTTAVAPTPSLWTRPLIAIVVIGALLRGYYLTQPMRYDESVTYLYFASQSWTTVVSSYTYPNNHVFHSLLVKAFATILGDDPWVLRSLPASRGFQPPTCADLARMALAARPTAVLTVLLYSPIVENSGPAALTGNSFVRPSE